MTESPRMPTDRASREDASPFEPAASGALGSAGRWLLMIVVVAAAAGAAWWFTRSPSAMATVPAGGTSGVAPVTDSLGNPVMLTAEGAGRIGVTYAVVERGSLTPDVRTVGIVAYDETRVKTIAPKIDGWVEQLYVSFTGQSVAENDPLLRIYSPMLVTAQEELLLAKKLATDVGNEIGRAHV